MTLKYHWENVTVNHLICDGCLCPHTKPTVEDVDYDYDVDVTDDDILDYLSLNDDARMHAKEMFDFLNECGAVDYEQLSNDKDFVEFMTERYENDAREDFEAGNDAY